MSRGSVFFNRGQSSGRAFRQHLAARKQEKRAKIAQFAEALSQDMNITAAARACGVSQQTGSIYFRQICEETGVSAAWYVARENEYNRLKKG